MQWWLDTLSKTLFQKKTGELNWTQSLAIDTILVLLTCIIALISFYFIKKALLSITNKIVKKTANTWDDELLKSKLIIWVSFIFPIIIIYKAAPYTITTLHDGGTVYSDLIKIIAHILFIIISFLSANSILNIIERIYRRYDVSKELPIKGILQVIKIILSVVSLIFIISALLDKPPTLIFTGLGAMTAIIMLIFKDSILGLVAGIQLSANRMVARGDWIEMPKFGADGEVLEVALTTVKVRNWDKTITTIPTYALISDSFKNWRGMSNSGVRRIKRSINIDMTTVAFLDEEMLNRMNTINLLKHYLSEKQKEISQWNASQPDQGTENPVNARALTNLGTFRAYIREYTKNHPQIDNAQTLLIRQLQPTPNGIPIELYIFTNDNRWVKYEDIQSDIFDHLLSILPEFKLRAFQAPSDHSFQQMTHN